MDQSHVSHCFLFYYNLFTYQKGRWLYEIKLHTPHVTASLLSYFYLFIFILFWIFSISVLTVTAVGTVDAPFEMCHAGVLEWSLFTPSYCMCLGKRLVVLVVHRTHPALFTPHSTGACPSQRVCAWLNDPRCLVWQGGPSFINLGDTRDTALTRSIKPPSRSRWAHTAQADANNAIQFPVIITLPRLESIDKLPFNVLKYLIESGSIEFEHGYRHADRSGVKLLMGCLLHGTSLNFSTADMYWCEQA